MANTYLTRTQTAGNNQKFTYSCWFKVGDLNSSETSPRLLHTELSNVLYMRLNLRLSDSCKLDWYFASGGTDYYLRTNRSFRDTSAWYHLVIAADSTQGSGSDRMKMYINGVQETSFAQSSYPPQNLDMAVNNNGTPMTISKSGLSDGYFTGLMSYVAFVDGTAELPTIFGETDSVTGQWKIKTEITPSVAWGTNGFLILKNGNSLTDESTNSNNFTLGGGTLTNTLDCPDNVFCTINPLNSYWAGGTFSNGNNTVVLPNKSGAWNTGTLGMTSGKYYWEIKCTGTSNGGELQFGIADKSPTGNTGSGVAGTAFGINSNGEYGIYAYNGAFIGNGVSNPYTSYGSSTANGIAMFAVDLDNNKFYGGANGTWFASGNPATGANGKTIQAVADTQDGCYYPAVGTYQGYTGTVECNFGNGYFGTTAVTSAGTAGSTPGVFEYDVPSGYQPLSTKGLNA